MTARQFYAVVTVAAYLVLPIVGATWLVGCEPGQCGVCDALGICREPAPTTPLRPMPAMPEQPPMPPMR